MVVLGIFATLAILAGAYYLGVTDERRRQRNERRFREGR